MGRKSFTRKSTRAGLVFPVSRIRKALRAGVPGRKVQKNCDVYLTSVVEYLVSELLEAAGAQVTDGNYIKPEHLGAAVQEGPLSHVFPKVAGL